MTTPDPTNKDYDFDKDYQMSKEIERLRKENETMRAALDRLGDKENYSLDIQDPIRDDIRFGNDTPWEYAQSVKDKLERSE